MSRVHGLLPPPPTHHHLSPISPASPHSSSSTHCTPFLIQGTFRPSFLLIHPQHFLPYPGYLQTLIPPHPPPALPPSSRVPSEPHSSSSTTSTSFLIQSTFRPLLILIHPQHFLPHPGYLQALIQLPLPPNHPFNPLKKTIKIHNDLLYEFLPFYLEGIGF